MTLLLFASLCSAQQSDRFRPAATNVWGAEYPRVDSAGRVQLRVKAPDATKVRLNFWSGPKVDMEKQPDGFWTEEPSRMREGLQKLHTSLLEASIQHVFYESPCTDHEWQTWRRDLKDFVPRLF